MTCPHTQIWESRETRPPSPAGRTISFPGASASPWNSLVRAVWDGGEGMKRISSTDTFLAMSRNPSLLPWERENKEVSSVTRPEICLSLNMHHRLDGHEFEQAPGASHGQGRLTGCSPWGRKGSDMTKQLNWTEPTCFIFFTLYQQLCLV